MHAWSRTIRSLPLLRVFVLGQVASRFFIEPCYEQRVVIGRIAEALLNYMHFFAYSGESVLPGSPEASLHLRNLSSELMARTVGVPGYSFLSRLRFIRKQEDINKASRGLVFLSNMVAKGTPVPSEERLWEQRLDMSTTGALCN